MSILADLRTYARFAWGLRSFLSHSITLEEARAIVQRRLAERESNFLRLVERFLPLRPLRRPLLDC